MAFIPALPLTQEWLFFTTLKKTVLCIPQERRGLLPAAVAGPGRGCSMLTQQQAVSISLCCVPSVPGQCLDHPVHLGCHFTPVCISPNPQNQLAWFGQEPTN